MYIYIYIIECITEYLDKRATPKQDLGFEIGDLNSVCTIFM